MSEQSDSVRSCAGVAVLMVVGSGVLMSIWAAAPNFALLAGWVLGTGAVWWYVSRAPNPAPPPPPEGAEEEKPQFTVVDDENNPNHINVVWDNRRDDES